MNNSLKVIKGESGAKPKVIDYKKYQFVKGSVNDENYIEYIELLSKLIGEKHLDKRVLSSFTLGRCEAISHFYDRLFKYLELLKLIEMADGEISIINVDAVVCSSLLKTLSKKGHRVEAKLDSKLKLTTRFYIKTILLFFRDILVWLLFNLLFGKPSSKLDGKLLLFSVFDKRSAKDGKYNEVYYGKLVEHLEQTGKEYMIALDVYILNGPARPLAFIRELKSLITLYKGIRNKSKLAVMHTLLPFSKILKIYSDGLKSRVVLDEPLFYLGEDITFITNEMLDKEYRNCHWIQTLFYAHSFEIILKEQSPSSIVYFYENYPWEKLIIGRRNKLSSKTKLIGFQHTSFSYKYANYLPGSYEKNLPYFPDKILTAGKLLKDAMNAFGHYPDGVVDTGCALRASYIFEEGDAKIQTQFHYGIAVSLSGDPERYPRMIDALGKAFDGTKYKVYLKVHPEVDVDWVRSLGIPESLILDTDRSWQEIYSLVDVVVYDDNTIAAECLKYNKLVGSIAISGQVYNTNRLYYYEGATLNSDTAEEFIQNLETLYLKDPEIVFGNLHEYNASYVEQFFGQITDQSLRKFYFE